MLGCPIFGNPHMFICLLCSLQGLVALTDGEPCLQMRCQTPSRSFFRGLILGAYRVLGLCVWFIIDDP